MQRAFTLAEVLITLVVIGIIAAMTIPNVFANINEKQTVTKLKKVYSTLSNATRAAVAMDGPIDYWEFDASDAEFNSLLFKKKLKLHVAKDCGSGTGCFENAAANTLKSTTTVNYETYGNPGNAKVILSDGTSVRINLSHPNCSRNAASGSINHVLNNICGSILVDIDGPKGSNTFGKDMFFFYISRNGEIVPWGADGINEEARDVTSCNLNSYGYACTAWVLYKGNTNYLKGETMEHW